MPALIARRRYSCKTVRTVMDRSQPEENMPRSAVRCLIAATVLIGGGGVAAARNLIYGAGIPTKSDEITIGVDGYAESLGTLSKGALTMKVLAGAQVVSLYNTLANLRDGTIDAGFVVPTFTRKELKNVNVLYDTEVFGDDPAAITGAANETMLFDCPECLQDFRNNGSVYLGSFGNNDKGLICRKPVRTVADVKGLKIRAVGATTRLIAALGGVPVVMSPPDATTALARGTIDCVHGVTTWLKDFGFWDVSKYDLQTPLGSPRIISSVVYSRATWNAMSAADRKVAVEAIPQHLARMVYLVNVEAQKKIEQEAIKEHHITFFQGGQDFKDFMTRFREKERTEIPAIDAKELGAKDASKIFAAFETNLAKWEKLAKANDLKDNMDAMTAIYQKEIYDRLDPSKL
jgi:TRAP-type transport system periplasmic protein